MNYLLLGPEEYLKQQFWKKLKKSILSDNKSFALDFEIFHAGTRDITEILGSLNTLPFISKKRLVVIKDVDKFSTKEKSSLLKFLKSYPESTVLVMESSSNISTKFLEQISRFAKPIRCQRLKKSELSLWIKKEFAFYKKKISPELAGVMGELAGKDLFLLKNEIEKIVSFLGQKSEVTLKDIEAVLGEPPYKTAFELVDLILEKKIDKALRAIGHLLVKEKPHQILNLLAWQFRNFIKIKNLPKHSSVEDVSRALEMNWGFAKRCMEEANRFPQSDLEKNLEIILKSDFSIKRGILDQHHALECALSELCGLA